ncbi:MAG: hypothetical protein V4678_03235 [Patescibacteria group bacterium]
MRVFSPHEQAHKFQQDADEREQDDASTQRNVIVVDVDGSWLINELRRLGNANRIPRITKDRCFSFLGEDAEVLLSRLGMDGSGSSRIEVPAGSMLRRVEGHDLDTWLFRVGNGNDDEYFDLAFRRIESGDHLLYLKYHNRKRTSSR